MIVYTLKMCVTLGSRLQCESIVVYLSRDLGSSRHVSHNISDDQVQPLPVAGGVVVKPDISASRPALWRTICLNDCRGLDGNSSSTCDYARFQKDRGQKA